MASAGHDEPLLQFFAPHSDHCADIEGRFLDLAHTLCGLLPKNPERTVALRKLLEARDCAIRARTMVL